MQSPAGFLGIDSQILRKGLEFTEPLAAALEIAPIVRKYAVFLNAGVLSKPPREPIAARGSVTTIEVAD